MMDIALGILLGVVLSILGTAWANRPDGEPKGNDSWNEDER